VDGLPVFVLFILLSPSVKIHLHLLSRLAFCVRDASFVDFLKQGPSPEELLEKVENLENAL
jgi:nitrogen PTS system EIIA component